MSSTVSAISVRLVGIFSANCLTRSPLLCRSFGEKSARQYAPIWLEQFIEPTFNDNALLDANGNIASQVTISKPDDNVRGDINASGNVDIDDLNICINIILGTAEANNYPGKADVNNSGIVDIDDLNIIINIILGNE
ncbi:MAG: hypothetical protein IJT30_10175 [Muribaculaceae bacterium]|nr:hypothetical protein [Muribaculaceae bacterium]